MYTAARIVLHGNVSREQYATASQLMAAINFTDEIKSAAGNLFKLPPAEYYKWTTDTAATSRDKISLQLKKMGIKYSVFVSAGGELAWYGLDEVQSQAARTIHGY